MDRLKDEGLISDVADLFTLDISDLSGLERFGAKSAENIISSIREHRKVPLWRFIYALGILHIGEQTAQDVANHFENLNDILKADIKDIESIENIGPVVAKSLYEYFKHKENLLFIGKLIKNGVLIEKNVINKNTKFKGQSFVFTGTLSSMSRDEAKEKVKILGGKVSSSVSKNTSYVVAGENPGSKYDEAVKLEIKILNEKDFINYCSVTLKG